MAHYRLIEKIGEGGMGVVWRALDTTLDREVAIKVLSDAAAADPDRLERFEREAKILASLNHPKLASIYGVHSTEEMRVLAMELVPGEDLGRILARGRLPLARAIEIARQIAEALEAAHARGIVHRDLKPSNVVVGEGDAIKVLDFGLAKALAAEPAPDSDPAQATTSVGGGTSSGVILGTVAYMSPEQARGRPVDTRTDIWSFGCVLWECLTGAVLFGAETASDSIGSILASEPDWSLLPPRTPPAVVHLLRRCLAKEPRERLHHIADARIELEDRQAIFSSEPAGSISVEQPAARRRKIARGVGMVLLPLAAVWVANLSGLFKNAGPSSADANPLEGARFTRITDFEGAEFDAAISPNGDFVTFVADRDGGFEAYVGQVGGGEFRNLTRGTSDPTLRDVRAPVRSVGFTGDGSEIWLGGGMGRRLRAVPLLSGPVRNLLGDEVVNVDWEPSGERIVFHTRAPGDPVYVASPSGAQSRLILGSEPGVHQHYPTWSQDGRWIYLVRGRPTTGEMDLWRIRPDGDDLERLTRGRKDVAYPAPLDARTVLFTAREEDGAGPWLWALDIESKTSRRVSFGTEQYTSVAASADGRRVVVAVANPRAGLWRVPILDRVATEADARPMSEVPTVRALAPRFGGRSLFFLSSRGTGDGLWRLEGGRAVEIWKGTQGALLEPPAVSPSGEEFALVLRRQGKLLLHALSSDGAELRLLSANLNAQGTASWSPDGRWLVTGGSDEEGPGLFKIPAEGGSAERIAEGEALDPVWSPVGDLIVFSGAQVNIQLPILAVRSDGTPVEMPDIRVLRDGERFRFLPDGSGLVYMQGLQPAQDFWLLDLQTMKSRQLTRLTATDTMRSFDVSPDGAELVFDRLQENSDIVLIELANERRPE